MFLKRREHDSKERKENLHHRIPASGSSQALSRTSSWSWSLCLWSLLPWVFAEVTMHGFCGLPGPGLEWLVLHGCRYCSDKYFKIQLKKQTLGCRVHKCTGAGTLGGFQGPRPYFCLTHSALSSCPGVLRLSVFCA